MDLNKIFIVAFKIFLLHICRMVFSTQTAHTIIDADLIIRKILKDAQTPKKLVRIKKLAKIIFDSHTITIITAYLRNAKTKDIKLQMYRHEVGAKLLKVCLIDEENEDHSSIVNEFFTALRRDKYLVGSNEVYVF